MKKVTLLFALGLSLTAWGKNEVFELNDGKVHTLEDLSKIEGSGVTKTGELTYTLVKDIELLDNTGFKVENKSVIKLGPDVMMRVYGPTQFAVTDTATICPTEPGNKCKGFHVYQMHATDRTISHVRFEEAGLSVGSEQGTVFENCSFVNSNGELTKYAITFSAASVNNVVKNCYFVNTQFSAVGNGSNIAAGITIENNIFEKCSTAGRNYPYINVCPSGDNGGTFIRNNKIIGGQGLMAGAISFSNMLTMVGANQVTIENNEMSDCRYGIQVMGLCDAKVLNNRVVNCHYEANANNGGSGLTISSSSATNFAKAYVEGNYIDGCLWGVTVIGSAKVNMGCLEENIPGVAYNPGKNEMRNNGNCGKAPAGQETAFDPSIPYDLYNNTTSTIYAQGNLWGGADQSATEIEKRIVHKADNGSLGEVIFLPAGTDGIVTITADKVFDIEVSGTTVTVSGVEEGTAVTVYDFTGAVIGKGVAGEAIALGRRGVVIVAAGATARRVAL